MEVKAAQIAKEESVSSDDSEDEREGDDDVLWFCVCRGCGRLYDAAALPCRSKKEECASSPGGVGRAFYVLGGLDAEIEDILGRVVTERRNVLFKETASVPTVGPPDGDVPSREKIPLLLGGCDDVEQIECRHGRLAGAADLWVVAGARGTHGLNVLASQQVGPQTEGGLLFGDVLLIPR